MRTSRSRTAVSLLAGACLFTACGDAGGDTSDGADDGAAMEATEAVSPDGVILIEAADLSFDPEQVSAEAGTVDFSLVNTGAVEHDLVIEEAGDAHVAHASPGETVTGSIELEPGTYTYYCSVPGHRAAMEGTLEVS